MIPPLKELTDWRKGYVRHKNYVISIRSNRKAMGCTRRESLSVPSYYKTLGKLAQASRK